MIEVYIISGEEDWKKLLMTDPKELERRNWKPATSMDEIRMGWLGEIDGKPIINWSLVGKQQDEIHKLKLRLWEKYQGGMR